MYGDEDSKGKDEPVHEQSENKGGILFLQARNYPSLQGNDISQPNMDKDLETINNIFPSNPIEDRDKEIAELHKELGNIKAANGELNNLKETVTKLSAELKVAKSNQMASKKKTRVC